MQRPNEELSRRSDDERSVESHPESDPSRRSPRKQTDENPQHRTTESEKSDDDGNSEYLIALDYQSDAERKRVEYLLNNRTGITVEKIRGLSRIIRAPDNEFQDFYEELSAKVDGLDHLRVNELSDVDVTPDKNLERFHIETDAPRDQIEWAFETIKRKRDATIEDRDSTGETSYMQYVATTQSGTVRYSYELDSTREDITRVEVHVWGYGDAPEVFRKFIKEELNYAI